MKKILFSVVGISLSAQLSAQLYLTDFRLDFSGVNNEGIAVGTPDQNQPFYLWDPFENTYELIGGYSAGEGVGGVARFTDDGKTVVAPMQCAEIPVSMQWQKATYPECKYHYTGIHKTSDYQLYAVSRNEDGTKGVILKSVNNGVTWKNVADDGACNVETGLECISSIGYSQTLAGGHHGKLYATTGNPYWYEVEIHPEGDNTVVDTYWAMDFIPDEVGRYSLSGVIGLEDNAGNGAVWYTHDSGETFQVASGVNGIPAHITHVDNVYYMVTKNGHIQKSMDHGASWTELFSIQDAGFCRVRFSDSQKGIALSGNQAYATYDGGETWNVLQILPSIGFTAYGTFEWTDAVWYDNTIMVVGTSNQVFCSYDDGKSFDKVNIDFGTNNDFGCIFHDRDAYNVMGSDGNLYHKSDKSVMDGFTAGIYDVATGSWKPLQSSGYDIQGVCSAPWQISGNGQAPVGNAYFLYPQSNNVQCHAAVWTDARTIKDLGSRFAGINRNSTAYASSYDGSVVVGWQDIFGPRYGAVWTRGEDGEYTQRMLLRDVTKNEDDINYKDKQECYDNLVGTCRTVSPDGKWLGGDGSPTSAFPGAWIWNKEEGFIQITDIDGATSEIFNDGSKAIGWEGTGQNAWLWTKEDGLRYIQDIVEEHGWGVPGLFICSAYDMSPNGRFITGYGILGDQVLGYVLDLNGTNTGIERVEAQVKAAVYPNPVVTELHVDLPYDGSEVNTEITLCDMQGHAVRRLAQCAQSNVINVAGLQPGAYVLDVCSEGRHKSFKIVIKH